MSPGVMAAVWCNLPAVFHLRALDSIGRSRSTGCDHFTVFAEHQASEPLVVEGQVEDHADGSYTCSWLPPVVGSYSLSVLLDGVHVRGSPFSSVASRSCNPTELTGPAPPSDEPVVWIRGEGSLACLHDGGQQISCVGGLQQGAPEWTNYEVMLDELVARGNHYLMLTPLA